MISFSAAACLTALILLSALFKRSTRPSLTMIRGPKSPSFVLFPSLQLLELLRRPVGEADFARQRQYGKVVQIKSIIGFQPQLRLEKPQEDRLLITDHEAVQRVFNTTIYTYSKLPNFRIIARMFNGKGLLLSRGEDHRRQTIASSNDQSVVIDVIPWISRGVLDAIGHAIFDVQFGTIHDDSYPSQKNVAKELVREKADALLLVSLVDYLAVEAANAKKKLSVSTDALARNPKVQFRLRDEIRKMEATIRARGDLRL
ncbi:hypothetical protein OG21DRAFT_1520220 [Imleria badia]|nr:hypothetical protein OG21DRAFT_1520220 [Imleria badia]